MRHANACALDATCEKSGFEKSFVAVALEKNFLRIIRARFWSGFNSDTSTGTAVPVMKAGFVVYYADNHET